MKLLLLLTLATCSWGFSFHFGNYHYGDTTLMGKLFQSPKDENWNGTIWALLVAGSNGWYNYRHQADVCHAYQVLQHHGIPEERIVVMMYDDLANNTENPTPGIIINKPEGPDVYAGVPKDYTGQDVTPSMFLRVLQGDDELASHGRKVISSGPHDHVFVYFADHGAPGLVAFPSAELMATDLNAALKKMSKQKKFAKMVVYIEACESGSMFNKLLPKNINVFATTAANSVESSYACYYDDKRETYLGDVYSVMWLEDSDKHPLLVRETLQQQFQVVKLETNTSHVQEFGDRHIGRIHVSEFQGMKKGENDNATDANDNINDMIHDAVASGDVPLMIAKKKLLKSKNEEQRFYNHVKFQEMLRSREFLSHSMKQIALEIKSLATETIEKLWIDKQPLENHVCYENLLKAFDEHCFDLSTHPYALRYLYIFVNFCELADHDQNPEAVNRAIDTMVEHCTQHVRSHPFRTIV